MAGASLIEASDLDLHRHSANAKTVIQRDWAATSLTVRLNVLRKARGILARMSSDLVEAIPAELSRTASDTRVAEILPLLAACLFLEDTAAHILRPKRLGRTGLPFWLAGVRSEVDRVPFGSILVIGPANYPLFLPGVQVLQALCAGNSVVWKPGTGGGPVAAVFAAAMQRAGLPDHLLRITDDSVKAGGDEIQNQPDKVFFTGSASAGRAVLQAAARFAIPVVAELSGCDAVIVLPSANSARVVDALAFGMRLNGSATCMAPRRLILVGKKHQALIAQLHIRFNDMPGIVVNERIREQVITLTKNAEDAGANVCGDPRAVWMKPVLVLNGKPEMMCAQTDIFAPILTVIEVEDEDEAVDSESACAYGLTAAIFGDEHQALQLGQRLQVGTILINDLMVPTADPRVPFGGRRSSGFGVTRGSEGLLEMTAVKTILVRRGRSNRHYQVTNETHDIMFDGVIQAGHAATWTERFKGIQRVIAAGRRLK